jgi:hypothetical protein
MQTAIHLIVILVGCVSAYLLGRLMMPLGAGVKFVAVSAYVLAFAYLLAWLNARALREPLRRLNATALLALKQEHAVSPLAWRRAAPHALLAATALLVGYGVATRNLVAIGSAVVGWWIADALLLKEARRGLIATTPMPLLNTLPPHSSYESLVRSIDERSQSDPLISAKVGALGVYAQVAGYLKRKGLSPAGAPLLCAIGALAGYSCQAHLRAVAAERSMPVDDFFVNVETADGGRLFFGDTLNNLLVTMDLSLWPLGCEAARYVGARSLPELGELFAHVARTAGTPTFGVPRAMSSQRADDVPIVLLRALWPDILPVLELFARNSGQWPLVLNIAAQTAIERSARAVRPEAALAMLMESAIAMSKVDLAKA